MEVRPRNKQTELAEVPLDWQIFRLADHFEIYAGGDVPKDLVSDVQSEKFPYPIYANALQRRGLYGYTNERRSKPDSITITARGYLGHAEYREEPFFPIVRLLVLEPRGSLDAKFSSYVINNRIVFPVESTGVPQLTAPQVSKYSLVAPTDINEQRAIAAALSDVDALIAGLEKLIAKKRDLKQAAMQQLLTGQTRLPGFSGEWRKTVFSKILRHHAGNSSLIKGKQFDRPMPNLFPGFSASGQDVWCSAYEYEGDAIVVSAVGSRCGKAFNATGKWCAIANTHVIWPDETRIDRRFLSFFVNDEDFWLKSGSGQPFVLFRQTFAREVLLPSIAEQVQISDAISDLEAELVALKNRLSKTRELKQGMMQELLTGRTRLI
jgi:type I restriction enzyme S subunit